MRQRRTCGLSGFDGPASSSSRQRFCTHTRRRTSTAGTSRSHAGAPGPVTALSSASPSRPTVSGKGAPGGVRLRHVGVAATPFAAFGPARVGMGVQPVGGGDRQGVERGSQRFDRASEAGQAPHGTENMGRVGPLPSALGQEALLATQDGQPVEKQAPGASFHETAAEFAQHGSVGPRDPTREDRAGASNRGGCGQHPRRVDPTGSRRTAAKTPTPNARGTPQAGRSWQTG